MGREKVVSPRWLHRGSALPKNHIIQYKCHFYSLFLLDFPTILSKIILLKKKQKNRAKCSAGLNKTTRFANQPAVTRPGKIQLSVILCGIAYPFLPNSSFPTLPPILKITHHHSITTKTI